MIILDEFGESLPEMLNCPFCGTSALFLTDNNQPHLHKVQCSADNCGACTAWWNWKKDTIEAWNKRVME